MQSKDLLEKGLDKYFPKGNCKERNRALMFFVVATQVCDREYQRGYKEGYKIAMDIREEQGDKQKEFYSRPIAEQLVDLGIEIERTLSEKKYDVAKYANGKYEIGYCPKCKARAFAFTDWGKFCGNCYYEED